MTNIENKWEAIRSINPNAVTMSGDKIFNNDGNEIFINETDITNKIAELKTAEDNKAIAKATAQASGNTKLLALGLSQEEATALTGYTPE